MRCRILELKEDRKHHPRLQMRHSGNCMKKQKKVFCRMEKEKREDGREVAVDFTEWLHYNKKGIPDNGALRTNIRGLSIS